MILAMFIGCAASFAVGYFVGIVRQSEKDLERSIRQRELAELHGRYPSPPKESHDHDTR